MSGEHSAHTTDETYRLSKKLNVSRKKKHVRQTQNVLVVRKRVEGGYTNARWVCVEVQRGGKTYPNEVGGCACDGWAKGRNKKSRSHGGDDVVVDDDGVSGSRLVDADVLAPGVLSPGFFSATKRWEKRRQRQKYCREMLVVSRFSTFFHRQRISPPPKRVGKMISQIVVRWRPRFDEWIPRCWLPSKLHLISHAFVPFIVPDTLRQNISTNKLALRTLRNASRIRNGRLRVFVVNGWDS